MNLVALRLFLCHTTRVQLVVQRENLVTQNIVKVHTYISTDSQLTKQAPVNFVIYLTFVQH